MEILRSSGKEDGSHADEISLQNGMDPVRLGEPPCTYDHPERLSL